MSKITVDRRLWLTTDGDLVEDGDPDAAFLWAGANTEVDRAEAERLGYEPTGEGPPDDDQSEPAEGSGSGLTIHTEGEGDEEPAEEPAAVNLDDYATGHGWYEYDGEKLRRSELAERLGVPED